MKALFPPDPPSRGLVNGSLLSSYSSLTEGDPDVSMDDSHASAMSGVTTESMGISSPPRTQRRKRNSGGLRYPAGPSIPEMGLTSGSGGSLRSRLFEDDPKHDNHESNTINRPPPADRKPGMVLKPLDLNQEFDDLADPSNSSNVPGSPRSRGPRHSNASSLTPLPPPQATVAMRKRQAEQHDLYGSDWNCGAPNDPDAFSVAESPVDMYTSPRVSPSSPGGASFCSSKGTHRPMSVQRSPYYPLQGSRPQEQQYHKSPSHFQTLDGRTVQSKNPFSPMIFGSKPLAPGNSPAPCNDGRTTPTLGLTHPLLLTTDSLSDDRTAGKPHLVLRHKLQKRGSGPCTPASVDLPTTATTNPMELGMASLTGAASPKKDLEEKASLYIRDGYPEQSGRYSFTGSPIKEHHPATTTATILKTTVSSPRRKPSPVDTNAASQPQYHQQPDFCTNIHKVRRRSKGDDVVAAAAQGEPSWKKDMYVKTFANESDKNGDYGFYNPPKPNYYYNHSKLGESQKDDGISPTDVLSFPHFRASPSDTTTLPPTPSKPVRKPPVRRYTPIRKVNGPPPTPMPGVRQAMSFEMDEMDSHQDTRTAFRNDDEDSSDDDGPIRSRRRRRPTSSPNAAAPPPSRFYTDFDVIDELGSGSFGNVFKALSRLDGTLYAIKVAHRVAKGNADRDRMLKEVYALAALSDQIDTGTVHIVRFHQAWMEEERLYIQTELCTTTLQAEMQRMAPQQLPVSTRFKCLREILLALQFIHKNKMVHLDIKPENIFLKDGVFKLGDFGLVSKVSSHDVEEGDSRYMSMELLSGDHADLTKSDIFSLGIAVYEICLGSNKHLPSNGPEWQSLRSGTILPPPNTTEDLFQIIKSMMNPIYQARPRASDLLELPELLSEEQKKLNRDRAEIEQANRALQQSKKMMLFAPSIPAPKGLTRRNTWSAF